MDLAEAPFPEFTHPAYLDQSEKLIRKLRRFSGRELSEFMEISEKLAELNRQRFKSWETPFTRENATQALFAFSGDVYDGLEAHTLNKTQIRFAQKHVRILSGLYGILRPLDLIQPYRLEMGRPLALRGTKNLYEFWRSTVTETLNQTPGDLVINLASQEYFKVIDRRKLNKKIINPVFKDEKNGRYKIISFFAKKARGRMAQYIIRNAITDTDGLCSFTEEGYSFSKKLSTPDNPVFTRRETASR